MPSISIHPVVNTKTVGGHDVSLFEIDPDDLGNGINGTIHSAFDSDTPKHWDDGGIARNLTSEFNLNRHAPEVAAVIAKLNAARASMG